MEGFGSMIVTYTTITTGIPAQVHPVSYIPNLRFLSDIPTYLVLPRPKCPGMFDGFALYNVNHRNHRLFRRYLSAIDFPGNFDVAHVSVCISLSMYASSSQSNVLTSTPLQDAELL